MFAPETPAPRCPHCGARAHGLVCTCRGCKDTTWTCGCDEATAVLLERDGLCAACADAGCARGLADFVRCGRLGAG